MECAVMPKLFGANGCRLLPLNCCYLRLTVLTTNGDAQRFYEREGMSVVDRTEERIMLQF